MVSGVETVDLDIVTKPISFALLLDRISAHVPLCVFSSLSHERSNRNGRNMHAA
jgi:DNA-binding response OmpR family regulator